MSLQCHKTIDCNQGSVRAVRYNVDGSYCLTCGSDRKIKLWNPRSGLLLKVYGGHGNEVTDVAGSCDSCHIVSSSLDKSIIYWDVSTGQPLRRLRVHAGGVSCVRFNEDSSIAVSGSKDNTVMIWDIRTRKLDPIQVLRNARDCITSLIVNDSRIVSASLDGCIRHYDIRKGELVCDNLHVPITYICETKDGQCIVAGCLDGVIRLTDTHNGGLLSVYTGRKDNDDYHIECGIMSNDSQIISGSTEGCLFIWNLLNESSVQKFELASSGVVHSLDTHPLSNEVLIAKRRDIYVCGPVGENGYEEDNY